jgi:uncharacterized glyoxalase superfamily protein PhnB
MPENTMMTPPGREGFATVTPYLVVEDLERYLAFLETSFDAEVTRRATGEGGGTHVEVRIGDSQVMIGESQETANSVYLFLYVADADAVYRHAVESGAESVMRPADGRFGEKRGAAVRDPQGHSWFIGQHK